MGRNFFCTFLQVIQKKRNVEKYLSEHRLNGFDLPEMKYRELTETWQKKVAEARRDYQWRIMTSTEKYRTQIKDPNVVRDFPVDVLKAMALDSTQPTKGPWTVTLHPYIYKQVMAMQVVMQWPCIEQFTK